MFDVNDLAVHVGGDVAFATALVRCCAEEAHGERVEICVRLTRWGCASSVANGRSCTSTTRCQRRIRLFRRLAREGVPSAAARSRRKKRSDGLLATSDRHWCRGAR